MSGHVDIRALVAAPLDTVWDAANDPAVWRGAGHPVDDLIHDGDRVRFRVATAPDAAGRRFSYQVERTADRSARTVYSRRFDSPEFRYSHVWFGYRQLAEGTEMRCVVDFEMRPEATLGDGEMAVVMERALARNLQETARRIEGAQSEGNGDG
jgi:hypothetical protein